MATVSPSPSAPYPNFVSIGSAIPDWTAYIGSSSESEVSYNSTTIGTANVSLLGPSWTSANPGIIDGSYSVILQAGGDPHNAAVPVDVSLAQNGTIPGNTESIRFDAWNPDDSLTVSFGGTSLQTFALATRITSSGQQVTTYGANISQFAGSSGTLAFSSAFNQSYPSLLLDNISFSANPITVTPEPDALTLISLGGLLFGLYCRTIGKRTRF